MHNQLCFGVRSRLPDGTNTMLNPLMLTTLLLGGLPGMAFSDAMPSNEGAGPATATPIPVAIWPAGPLEVRVAFDGPIPPTIAPALVGKMIPFGEPADSGGAEGGPRLATTLGRVRIAAARVEDEGRTLVLATDPHPRQATYLLTLPAAQDAGHLPEAGRDVSLAYDLSGAEVHWEAVKGGAEPGWSGWWPGIDPATVLESAGRSVEHERGVARLKRPGRLTLRFLVMLPRGKVTVRLESDAPLKASLAFDEAASKAVAGGLHRAEWQVASAGEALELSATFATGEGNRPTSLRASYHFEGDSTERPLPRDRQILPWVPPTPPTSASTPLPGPVTTGGDPRRGEEVFNSVEAKCSACHKIRGRGGDVGPALDGLGEHDPAGVYRDIAEPSAVIHPEYLPYTVAMKDGRVVVGVVRAEGADAIRVLDTNGQATVLPRADVEELRPSGTSVIPVGLVGALGEARMRDLMAFLLTSSPGS
jgi:putative heme-binding domain-containing protein